MHCVDEVYSNTPVPTQVNTSQHESTRVNTSPTRVNTNQHESNTSQRESETSQHESTRVRHKSVRINTREKVPYNHFHNILRLFDVLPNFPFTTSETMGDYYL